MSLAVLIPSKTSEYLHRCLSSLEASQPGSAASVIVGDSSHGLLDGIRADWPQVRFVDVPQPFVFAHAINLMQKAVPGHDTLVLNDDTEMATPHWQTFCEALLASPAASAYGIISLQIDGGVGNGEQRAQGLKLDEVVETDKTVCFVAALIPTRAWQKIGPMDERFTGYGLEDDDFCHRARAAGLKCGVSGAATVRHGAAGFPHSSTYLRTLGMWEYRRQYEYNQRAFAHKYNLPFLRPAYRHCLNIGCGDKPRARQPLDTWVNLDGRELPGVDVVRDLRRGLPFSDACFDHILCDNVLEHFVSEDAIFLLNEIGRVLRPLGTAEIVVPNVLKGEGAYQDPTHRSFWTPRSVMYWSDAITPYGGRAIGITADLVPYPDPQTGIQIGGDESGTEVFIRFLVQKRPRNATLKL